MGVSLFVDVCVIVQKFLHFLRVHSSELLKPAQSENNLNSVGSLIMHILLKEFLHHNNLQPFECKSFTIILTVEIYSFVSLAFIFIFYVYA